MRFGLIQTTIQDLVRLCEDPALPAGRLPAPTRRDCFAGQLQSQDCFTCGEIRNSAPALRFATGNLARELSAVLYKTGKPFHRAGIGQHKINSLQRAFRHWHVLCESIPRCKKNVGWCG